jgi:serine/threonine protein kinase/Flp pilus assembly protein TadD
MNWNLSTGIWPPPKGKGKSTVVCVERASSLSLESPVASAEMETGLLASRSRASFPRDDPRVVAALEAYLEALRCGRGWSRDEFLAQHFEISEVLGQCLSGLEFIQAAAVQLEHSRPFLAGDPAGAIPPRARLGDYRILREIGRGGMGVVYEAEQISLGRHVALKVLPFAAAIDPKQRQRFQIEAQAAAQLHHPHIVPIFNVGCDHGIHYYAMQFVEGRSLAAVLHELRHGADSPVLADGSQSAPVNPQPTEQAPSSATNGQNNVPVHVPAPDLTTAGPVRLVLSDSETDAVPGSNPRSGNGSLSPTAVGPLHQDRAFCQNIARLGIEAADALEHAHGLGILHRDIKPANLLIDPDGSLWVTDFGLALFPSDLSLTHTGDVVGTLRYMSPEQALARRGVVDQRTDVYALGATLYELLTLQPAFDGRDHQELLRQIALSEPVRPRRLNPAVPRDLETIVLKAMAKDPSTRYTTAADLAADLRRFLDDRPILARRPNPVELSLRWALRHRELVATTTAIIVLALIVGSVAIWTQARKTQDANRRLHAYIIETFPRLDALSMASMGQTNMSSIGSPVPAVQGDAIKAHEQALHFYEQASNLPPVDIESRVIIARAYNRLGYLRAGLTKLKKSNTIPPFRLMKQADDEINRAHDLFAELLEQHPEDPTIRRGYADALGMCGEGCYYAYTKGNPQEAEQRYRQSVQLWRSLIRSTDTTSNTSQGGAPAKEVTASDLSDIFSLGNTVSTLTWLLDNQGRVKEADDVRQQFDDDVAVLAERLSNSPNRRDWSMQLTEEGLSSLTRNDNFTAALKFRMVTTLDPDNPAAHNNLAWSMTRFAGPAPFHIERALASARKAVELDGKNWMCWNTLGVAAFRAKDWKSAENSLRKSIDLNGGGGAIDFFFLAMTRWHQGDSKEAQNLFNQGANYFKHNPADNELRLFHSEADTLLKQPSPKSNPEKRECDSDKNVTETAQQCSMPKSGQVNNTAPDPWVIPLAQDASDG